MRHDTAPSRRVLDSNERVSEILFGLIMVLTFTGALSVAESGQADVREMLIGALGCNLAWGFIDAVFYLMAALAEKGRNLTTFLAIRRAASAEDAQRLIAEALPPLVASVLEPAELAALHHRLSRLPDPPKLPRLAGQDWVGALGVLLLVSLSTFPVVIPFVFMHEIGPAMRVSDAIAIVMLAACGAIFGRITGRNPWVVAIGMVVFGALIVSLTIALGG